VATDCANVAKGGKSIQALTSPPYSPSTRLDITRMDRALWKSFSPRPIIHPIRKTPVFLFVLFVLLMVLSSTKSKNRASMDCLKKAKSCTFHILFATLFYDYPTFCTETGHVTVVLYLNDTLYSSVKFTAINAGIFIIRQHHCIYS